MGFDNNLVLINLTAFLPPFDQACYYLYEVCNVKLQSYAKVQLGPRVKLNSSKIVSISNKQSFKPKFLLSTCLMGKVGLKILRRLRYVPLPRNRNIIFFAT